MLMVVRKRTFCHMAQRGREQWHEKAIQTAGADCRIADLQMREAYAFARLGELLTARRRRNLRLPDANSGSLPISAAERSFTLYCSE